MKTKLLIITLLILSSCNISSRINKTKPEESNNWALLDFVKADSINPILKPSSDQVFFCPLNKREIRWEERNVLNPSAVVKDDKVYICLLYTSDAADE